MFRRRALVGLPGLRVGAYVVTAELQGFRRDTSSIGDQREVQLALKFYF